MDSFSNNNSHFSSNDLADIVASSPVGMIISRADGSFIYANKAIANMLGYSEEEIYHPDVIISHPSERERNKDIRQSLLDNPHKTITVEKTYRHKDGQNMTGLTSFVTVTDDNSNMRYFIAQVINISGQKNTEKSVNLFRSMINSSREAMFILDPSTGEIVDANVHGCKSLGYSYEELLTLSIFDIDINIKSQEEWDRVIATVRNIKRMLFNGLHQCADDSTFHAEVSINHINSDGLEYILAISRDVTERKKSEKLIWEQANYDSLTKLPNRHRLYSQLNDTIRQAAKNSTSFAMLCLDVDNFKEVNDTLGHHIGDRLLCEIGQRIQKLLPLEDTVARIGGDKFCIIANDAHNQSDISAMAEKILHVIKEPIQIDAHKVFTSTSIGACSFPKDATDANGLIKYSDQAMYAAKQEGRDRLHHFTKGMQRKALDRMELSRDLHSALQKQQFYVEYQPIFCMKNKNIMKAEALIRWQHPKRGLVGPHEFIPIAEANGTIDPIGHWVFEQAIATVKKWRTQYHPQFQITVNASPLYFREGNKLIDIWLEKLAEANLPGDAIVIEITEGLLLESSEHVTNTLKKIQQCGAQIALDDFGTGYSSLAYLNKLNINFLKIDKSFIDNLRKESNEEALCEAMIVMAHKLKLKVIAEGIETPEQYQLLDEFGCNYGQGFLIAKSLSAESFEQLLASAQENSLSVGLT